MSLRRLPIRLRVTLVFGGVMAVVLVATGLFVYLRLESQLNESLDDDLDSRAGQLTRLIRVSDVGLGEPARTALRSQGESFAQVLRASGRPFDPSAQPFDRPALAGTAVSDARRSPIVIDRSDVPGLSGIEVRLLATPITFEGTRLIVVVGESLQDRDEALRNLRTLLLIGGPIALLLAMLAAYGTVAAALRPVDAMREGAAEISATEAERRLPVPAADDELRRLGQTLNAMLDRLQTAIERERAFVDDASHELRTPLALHRTELELALKYGESPEELRAAIASAIAEADRLSQLAEDLLLMARSDKDRLRPELKPVKVDELLETVRERLSAPAAERGRSLAVENGNGLTIAADTVLVERALANLVENALHHGEGRVRLWAHANDDGVELHVADAGPGFPPEFLPHAFERFRRADTARGEGGTGLGLAIVEAIATAHGGRAVARNLPEGGADVHVFIRGLAA